MIYVISILSLFFLIISFLIISKSLKLSQKSTLVLEGNEANVDCSNNANAFGFILFLVLGSIGAAWSFFHSKPDFLPVAASDHGLTTDRMFWVSMGVITFAFFVTNALLFVFSFIYRYKKDRKVYYYPVNHKLEIIWTIVPAVVMALLVFTGWKTWSDITSEAPEDSVVIEITGHQFGWYVRYAGNDDNKLGNHNYKLIDENNSIGIDFKDKNSFDDFTATELHLPKGKHVLLKIVAQDVLHSVYLPYQRVKMDAVPGMPTKFWFVANKSTDEMKSITHNPDFNYKLNCTEICGRGHFGMAITVFVDEPEDFNAWCKLQKPFLTQNPTYLSFVPENLKSKAQKYILAPEVKADSTTTTASIQ
ncbi:MAG: cytochrome c oxidase subunit II [Pseudarcicella sp.]|nr:cytochrome c oxidase subunit II [Pseudarcicella sp.]MBP6409785.1 cytochrome c oxidase subunit II [Pseudarcicella sp.]